MPICTLHLRSFTCHKATTGDRQLYFPSEGWRAEYFFALKNRRLQPGVNPRTWFPKASTLPLDHRSRWGSPLIRHIMKHVLHGYSPENWRLLGDHLICKAVIFSGKHSSLFYLLNCTSVIQIHVLTFVIILPVYKKPVPLPVILWQKLLSLLQ
jgi:hypothetical protein